MTMNEPSIKSDGIEILKFNLVLCFLNTFDNTMVSFINNMAKSFLVYV